MEKLIVMGLSWNRDRARETSVIVGEIGITVELISSGLGEVSE